MPPRLFKKAGLCLFDLLLGCLSCTIERDYPAIKVDRGRSLYSQTLGKVTICSLDQFSLVRVWRECDRNTGFFCRDSQGAGILFVGYRRKVEGKCYRAAIGVYAAPVEVRRRAKILLDHTQNPVLIWPIVDFRLFQRLAPLGCEAVERETLAFEDRPALYEKQRVLLQQFRHRKPVFQGL